MVSKPHVRIQLVVPGSEPKELSQFLSIPGFAHEVRQLPAAAVLSLIAEDSNLVRAKLVEFIASTPGTAISVVRSVVYGGQSKTVQALVETAFGAIEEPISYNMKEAARRLGISYSHIKDLVYLGRLQRENGRISTKELERFLGLRLSKRAQ